MDKKTLLSEIDKTIIHIESVINLERKEDLNVFIKDLESLKIKVINNGLKNNSLRGFPRRYVEMYNDYLNPVTDILDRIERKVDAYLDREI